MKKTIGTRLLTLLLTLSMLFALSPAALAQDDDYTGVPNDSQGEAQDPTPVPTKTYTLTSIQLSGNTLAMKVGDTNDLKVTVTLFDGTESKEYSSINELPDGVTLSVDWLVENQRGDEVSVTPNGSDPLTATVKALAIPETTETDKSVRVSVTVKLGTDESTAKMAACEVTVTTTDKPGISVAPTTLEIAPGSTGLLTAVVTPETAPQDVTWSSGDDKVATVAADTPSTTATVSGVSAGETKITASANGIQTSSTVQVQGIVLDEEKLTMRAGKNSTLKYTIYGDSLKDKGVTWTSSDSNIVQVDQGYLYALNVGTATITVKINGVTYTDSVEVTVEKATAEVIHASASVSAPLSFSSLTYQLQNQCSNVLGRSLSYVGGLSVSTDQGTLYYHYTNEGDTGAGVGTGQNYYLMPGNGQNGLSEVSFVPKSDFEGTAVISYTGYASGTEFFQGTIEVTVSASQGVAYTAANGNAVQFDASDFARACRDQTGGDLSYVTFSLPDESRGTLYYNYLSEQYPGTEVSASTQYKYAGSPNLGDVYFLPAAGASGEVSIPYTGRDVNGTTFRGRVTIKVSGAAASGDLTYKTAQGSWVTFDDSDFNSLCRSLTGYNLDRVRFTLPDSAQGTLYYNFTSTGNYTSTVSESRDYYRSSAPYLDNVAFVPQEDFAGTVSIPFTAWDVNGNRFYGEVGITVSSQSSSALRYTTFQGGKAAFDADDFNNLCMDLTGSRLSYVRFTLPASSQGTLYYKYTASGSYDSKVSDSRNYYRTSTPRLDDVSFVASSSASGVVAIPFTGWSTDGDRFSGTVEIDVVSAPDPLSYEVTGGNVITFQDADFDNYCRLATGNSLSYVRFNLPDAARGTLYYDYNTSTKTGTKVTASRNYYRTSSPYLDRVSFVPSNSYSGTFSMGFTGWSTEGTQFTGTITIKVNQGQAGAISYSTSYQPVTFRVSDFSAACAQRGQDSLVSVQFTGVDSLLYGGHLYYRYNGIGSASSQVRSSTVYSTSGTPNLSEVTFVPKVGYSGTVSLSYTGTDSNGGTFQGAVRIQVTPNTTSRYFTDMTSYGWAAAAVDFLYENEVVTGTGSGIYFPQTQITRGSFLVMLDRAFNLPDASGYTFSDVSSSAYYTQAIQRCYAAGVVTGYPDGTMRPDAPITREAAAVMICRAMQVSGWSLGSGNESALYGYSDWQSVSGYARSSMAVLVENGIFSGDNMGRLMPGQTMTRAEMAVVLARTLTL